MLEQVYSVILNIPDTVIMSIPSLKSPSVLTELKRLRQKIKNKIKIGKTRLMNDYSKPSTSSNNNQSNEFNESNTSTNKWFNNHSDFQTNNTPPSRLTFNHSDIYSRERLNVNQLNSIVNDNNFDSFTASDVQKSIQTCSTNNNFNTRSNLETNKISSCNSFKGKNNIKSVI